MVKIAPAVAVQSTLVAELTYKLHGILVHYVGIANNFSNYNIGCTRTYPLGEFRCRNHFHNVNNNHVNYSHNTNDGECNYG